MVGREGVGSEGKKAQEAKRERRRRAGSAFGGGPGETPPRITIVSREVSSASGTDLKRPVMPSFPRLGDAGGVRSSGPSLAAEITSWLVRIGEGVRQVKTRENNIAEKTKGDPIDEEVNRYLRDSLRVAKETLDTAYHALQALESHRGSPNSAEVREAINALSDTSLWYELLEKHGLANDSSARSAVEDLAEQISQISATEVPADPLTPLLDDISRLREVIVAALHEDAPPLSPSFVRDCLNTTRRIGAEVSIGLVVLLAGTEAAGTTPARIAVVCTAIGAAAGATAKQVWGRFTRAVRARTVEAQLQQQHHELLDSLSDLAIYLGCLAGDDPPAQKQRDLVVNIHLAVKFQIGHIEQLVVFVEWPQRDGYVSELARVKKRLAEIPTIVVREDQSSVMASAQQFRDARGRLDLFTHGIDEIRPSWQLPS
jgi:hypothetical protein